MKNKILLTGILALIGLFSFSFNADATDYGRRHKHVIYKRGHRVVIWHNNYRQCGNGYGNGYGNNGHNRGGNHGMCSHMQGIWNNGRNGRVVVRCNHRGCNMYGANFRNGRMYNNRGQNWSDQGNRNDRDRYGNNNRYDNDNGRGNNGYGKGNSGRGNGHGYGRR